MSDEQLEDLGIPRRKFLMRAGIAFAAPVVVSFAFDGVAEASPGQLCGNMVGYPNMTSPIYPNMTCRHENGQGQNNNNQGQNQQ